MPFQSSFFCQHFWKVKLVFIQDMSKENISFLSAMRYFIFMRYFKCQAAVSASSVRSDVITCLAGHCGESLQQYLLQVKIFFYAMKTFLLSYS
jgi:hypothetical protein